MTGTARRVVRDDIANFMGNWTGDSSDAHLFKLDPPLDGHFFVAVLVLDYPSVGLDRTDVFAALGNGGAVPHPGGGLAPQRSYRLMSHAQALAELGYTVSTTESED
ncbi:hypothetical protein [Rhodococcoides fascians]|uniref:hypothetical protein n=1 Tax=Rhodococcoides fascians TaxID=1828 RepID=UPI00056280F7|nr:hypothetical protein [Rhodococcus fascians]